MASTMASIRSWPNSASSSHACFARRASARASAMEARSRAVWGAGSISIKGLQGAAFWQDPFDLTVRSRNDVDRHELANAARGGRAGVGCGLHRADIAADHDRDVAGADIFLAAERDGG